MLKHYRLNILCLKFLLKIYKTNYRWDSGFVTTSKTTETQDIKHVLARRILGGDRRDQDSQQIFTESYHILTADFLEYSRKYHLCVSPVFTSPERVASMLAGAISVLSGRYQYIWGWERACWVGLKGKCKPGRALASCPALDCKWFVHFSDS